MNQVFQQSVGISMGTNCAPLLADLFLYSYGAEFVHNLLHEKENCLQVIFNSTFRYIGYVYSIYNNNIYQRLEIKDAIDFPNPFNYLDISLKDTLTGN